MRGPYGGLVAIRLRDGLERWYADLPPHESMAQHPGISAAVTAMPGVVFSAGLDGTLRAFSSFDGRPIWQYNTAKDFETVNGVKARGGSIGSAGADRKSTRLNSSHLVISYAVFCLKKKTSNASAWRERRLS